MALSIVVFTIHKLVAWHLVTEGARTSAGTVLVFMTSLEYVVLEGLNNYRAEFILET